MYIDIKLFIYHLFIYVCPCIHSFIYLFPASICLSVYLYLFIHTSRPKLESRVWPSQKYVLYPYRFDLHREPVESLRSSYQLPTGMWLCHPDHASAACSRHSHSSLQFFCKSPNQPMFQRSCPGSREMELHSCTQISHDEDSDSQILLQAHPFLNGPRWVQYLHETWCTKSAKDEVVETKVATWHRNSTGNAPPGACSARSKVLGCNSCDGANARVGTERHQHHHSAIHFPDPTKDACHGVHLELCKTFTSSFDMPTLTWATHVNLVKPRNNRSEFHASRPQTTSKIGCTRDIQRSWHTSAVGREPRDW